MSFPRENRAILHLADENYALESACVIREPERNLRYCIYLSALNHSYWILGVMIGTIVVCLLGMEFSMAALFLVILMEQVRKMFR